MASTCLFFVEEINPSASGSAALLDRLLTPGEHASLEGQPRPRWQLVMVWAGEVYWLGAQHAGKPDKAHKKVAGDMSKIVQHMREMADVARLPIPFQYYHLVCLMVVICALSWALQIGIDCSYGGIIIFFVAELIFIGMIQLASQLADPFGDDDVDFPVAKWMCECFAACEAALERTPHPLGAPGAWGAVIAGERRLDLGFDSLGGSEEMTGRHP
uniref:Uncharacterized protein n=1 Tax=Zooxanthella nutricula TaxID=1333877 RepID=A0A7S2NND7_9DINO|eukprot:CAMPEP_0198523436 /NCGR_PEP_ID=MMETSP1462-20131121/22140_1 /TAXON_ID=1333877 /ORGANISM="Brandtodinium nutriculum, Strain RCC3387" /LENGTH=214 /DNA_ID=CAMNT_0044253133 /DNA_START=51 /DNA_END=695 /DNA_ORIENTATION=-